MDIKSRTLYVKNGKEVARHSYATNRRFLARLRACPAEPRTKLRVVVTYEDPEKEYDVVPRNDSGWYTNKKELVKTAKEFLEG